MLKSQLRNNHKCEQRNVKLLSIVRLLHKLSVPLKRIQFEFEKTLNNTNNK